ncbi:hypothetical protein [Mycolicibacterium hippocampi]|uniref:Uncharacterized protein n=1 Tax=Mycolicibacterium hippocampi TaxID=659824 RepID=A0A7I9ZV94_9MYCO|nr:hypothetical protein [Mycolicibacterium hippocampi]GFH04864.1 hypothetical protein MHIP_53470 [Mycolicibacterium hippocampi]
MADDEPLDNIDAESLALRRKLFEKYGPHVDLVGLAAIGITRRLWRNDEYGYVEEAHNRITDGEMMAANVATTRLVLEGLGTYPEVDWQTLADALTDPHRVAGRRTAVDLLGKTRHRRWASWARKFILAIPRVIDQHGAEYVVLGLANDGAVSADWWGGPPLATTRRCVHRPTKRCPTWNVGRGPATGSPGCTRPSRPSDSGLVHGGSIDRIHAPDRIASIRHDAEAPGALRCRR